ncbi:MAG: hypothetical protein C0407_01540 [Desulfobacca sp.]|nr:hypothetical protein [Desulfobacca sp.]
MEPDTITRRIFLRTMARGGLSLAAGSALSACASQESPVPAKSPAEVIRKVSGSPSDPPNIILINADDLGYGDLGCYGSRAIRTPHMDNLAREGVRFTDFHACDSVCTPSRAGLLTGRYPKRMDLFFPLHPDSLSLSKKFLLTIGNWAGSLGLIDTADGEGSGGLPSQEITLPQALKLKGYRTGMVGKWHLGDFAVNPAYNPVNHGFDSFFGVPYSNDMSPFPLYRNTREVEAHITDQSKLTGLYTEEAIRFIRSGETGPFFLYLAHTFPHRPLYASKDFQNRSPGGLFGDVVEEIDWSVGKIVKALKAPGRTDNTLVIITSDNGPWYEGSPGPFRGRKGQSYEGGHRVPFIAYWPRHIPSGSICQEPAMNIDLFPTCLALAGLTLPSDRLIDGRDITALLNQSKAKSPHEALYFYHHGHLEGVRSGTWKYFRSLNHYVWPMPVNKKLGTLSQHTTGPLPLLFNLEIDPGEAYNLITKHPDIGKKLDDKMIQWERQMVENPFGWIK